MTPNIAKTHKDTAKFFERDTSSGGSTQTDATESIEKMDGDHAGKTMDREATAMATSQDMTDGLHETTKNMTGQGIKETGHGTSIFSKDGVLGKQFTSNGAIGGTAQKIGGPFDQQGIIGKNFTTEGAIGGTAQKLAEKNEAH